MFTLLKLQKETCPASLKWVKMHRRQNDIFHGLSGELPLKWDKNPSKKFVTIHDLIFVRYPQYYSFLTENSSLEV
jgi:hypothetical protein